MSDSRPADETDRETAVALEIYNDAIPAALDSFRRSADWSAAALLALNGGALVAVLGSLNKVGFQTITFALFGFGAIVVVLSAILSNQINHHRWLDLLEHRGAIVDWKNGWSESPLPEKARHIGSIWHKLDDTPFWLRILSAILFICGAAMAARDVTTAERISAVLCKQVEADMLRRAPIRSDSPAVFQALGCRPQGEGSVYAPPRSG